MKCWICSADHGTPMMLPGFIRPVPVCGNCVLKALRIIEGRKTSCGG